MDARQPRDPSPKTHRLNWTLLVPIIPAFIVFPHHFYRTYHFSQPLLKTVSINSEYPLSVIKSHNLLVLPSAPTTIIPNSQHHLAQTLVTIQFSFLLEKTFLRRGFTRNFVISA